jgi:fructoselysine-6-P-deglycase FrlB-like protein
MTDKQGTPEGSPGFIQPWIAQLQKITEELAGMTGLSKSLLAQPAPSLPDLPLPGAVSAAQVKAMASALAAQRSSIAALQAQLTAFDDQLEALEGILGPLAEWSKKWAEFERLVTNARGKPE